MELDIYASQITCINPLLELYLQKDRIAAVYTLSALDPHGLKIGVTFMLFNDGWATVDLITNQLSLLQQNHNLVEASLGSGSLCGALFLSRSFEEFLDKKLGNELGWDDKVLKEAYMGDVWGTVGEEFQNPGSQRL